MESIKAWELMKEGIRSTIRQRIPTLSPSEIEKTLKEIEEACAGMPPDEVAGCAYRVIEEKARELE
ncbi:MAG: hypothetical protein JRD89_00810 [Deltaproteobacteria bacterium]|nr:hypothetical protein [Deltaproteobacteria bacterium]